MYCRSMNEEFSMLCGSKCRASKSSSSPLIDDPFARIHLVRVVCTKAVNRLLKGTYLQSLPCLVALASGLRRVAQALHKYIRIRLIREATHAMRLIRVYKGLHTVEPIAME